jgi:hypothetical protein
MKLLLQTLETKQDYYWKWLSCHLKILTESAVGYIKYIIKKQTSACLHLFHCQHDAFNAGLQSITQHRETSVRTVGMEAKIQKGQLPNTTQKCYCLSQLALLLVPFLTLVVLHISVNYSDHASQVKYIP